MMLKQSLLFSFGVVNAMAALAVIPFRQTAIGKTPVGTQLLRSAPSFFGLLALLMLLLAALNTKSPSTYWTVVIIITAGTLVHEVLQNWTSQVFDYLDLIAILCGLIAFSLFHAIAAQSTQARPDK